MLPHFFKMLSQQKIGLCVTGYADKLTYNLIKNFLMCSVL